MYICHKHTNQKREKEQKLMVFSSDQKLKMVEKPLKEDSKKVERNLLYLSNLSFYAS